MSKNALFVLIRCAPIIRIV